jgi:hypothetical protein
MCSMPNVEHARCGACQHAVCSVREWQGLRMLGVGVSPFCCYVYLENIGFVYPAMSMVVIGPSLLTKTKSVESAV